MITASIHDMNAQTTTVLLGLHPFLPVTALLGLYCFLPTTALLGLYPFRVHT